MDTPITTSSELGSPLPVEDEQDVTTTTITTTTMQNHEVTEPLVHVSTSNSSIASHEGSRFPNLSSSSVGDERYSLSRPLWWLYFLHGGFGAALPTTAIMYLINSHVELTLSLLPTYGAIEFLPFSLKPMYAFLASCSKQLGSVDQQMSLLMVGNAVVLMSTAFVPKHGVLIFMVLGFLRGLLTAWPELLMGLSLVDQAVRFRRSTGYPEHRDDDHHSAGEDEEDNGGYGEAAARMQAQAATARNLGSVTAYVVALLFFTSHLALGQGTEPVQLNQVSAAALFGMTSISSLLAALIAWWNQVGKRGPSNQEYSPRRNDSPPANIQQREVAYYQLREESDCEDSSEQSHEENQEQRSMNLMTKEAALVILLQMTVILFALRQLIAKQLSTLLGGQGVWYNSVVLAVLVIMVTLCWYSFSHANSSHRLGLFLILRHIIPNSSYLVDTFRYTVFSKAPFLLQLLSLFDMFFLTGASWSFGRWFSTYSSGTKLKWLIAATTVTAAAASLPELWLIGVSRTGGSSLLVRFAIASITGALASWTTEWRFLPEVVLATVALNATTSTTTTTATGVTSPPPRRIEHEIHSDNSVAAAEDDEKGKQRGMQYGAFITCIDFGDQLGALVSGALISQLGITRENEWNHLENHICLCALLGLLSVSLLVLLP